MEFDLATLLEITARTIAVCCAALLASLLLGLPIGIGVMDDVVFHFSFLTFSVTGAISGPRQCGLIHLGFLNLRPSP